MAIFGSGSAYRGFGRLNNAFDESRLDIGFSGTVETNAFARQENFSDWMGAYKSALSSHSVITAPWQTFSADTLGTGKPGPVQTIEASGFSLDASPILTEAAVRLAGVEGGIASLGKLGYGLAEIFVESQTSAVGLSGQARGEAMSTFVGANGAARIHDGMIAIDAIARDGNGAGLLAQLESLGVVGGAAYGGMAGGYIALDKLDDLAALDGLAFARPVYAGSNVGLTTSQAYQSMNVDYANTTYGVTGAGITIGVLSDSFDTRTTANTHYAQDILNGDLPSGVNVLLDYNVPGSDEGRAMAQAIYDIAPGANLAFHSAFISMASFAQGIVALSQISDIVVDDIFYYAEPFFQDGIVAQAVDTATANGAMYFSSAGNQASQSYQGAFVSSGTTVNITGANAGTYTLMDFNTGAGVDFIQRITKTGTAAATYVLNWDQPSASTGGVGSQSDLALIFYNSAGTVVGSVNANNINGDAIELAQSTSTAIAGIAIGLRVGSVAPTTVKYITYGAVTINEYATNSGTSVGHANAATALSIGASDWVDSSRFGTFPVGTNPFPYAEVFTSKGGVPILFDAAGNRLASPLYRTNVDFTASDGGNNSFFGSDASYDADTYPNFYGTSQAAPNAAAVAALMMQMFPTATRAEIETALKSTALDILYDYNGNPTGVGSDLTTGAGLIQADAAIAALRVLVTPVLSIDDVTLAEGDSGTTTFTFTVSLSRPAATGGVTFDIATADGSATAGVDYVAQTLTSQTIPAGSSNYTFTVTVNGDIAIENDETFLVNVTNVSGATVSDAQGLGTIVNGDANTAPTLASNTGLTLDEGAAVTISAAALDYNDPQEPDSQITYTIDTAITNGILRRGVTVLGVGSTYTQADVNAGLINYTHNGGETTSGGFDFTVSDGQGGSLSGQSFAFTITPVDDAAVAVNDAFATAEDTVLTGGNVFAANPTTPDSDVDSALTVTAVNGSGANVGVQITLASGALLTLNADGTFSYDANGAFDKLGIGYSKVDTFTYRLNDDDTATVSVTINGVDSDDVIVGTSGANTLDGGIGDDQVFGLGGADTLNGGDGNDLLSGGLGADTMTGGGGDDRYNVDNTGDIVIEADGEGIDTVISSVDYTLSDFVEDLKLSAGATGTGNALANKMTGSDDYDLFLGLDGNDTLIGGGGDDALLGGEGNDVLRGELGEDIITGGAGSDRFVITGLGLADTDTISDFSHAERDRIGLRSIDAIAGGGDDNFTFIGTAAFSNVAGQLRYQDYGNITVVQGDIDGDGTADLFVALTGSVELVKSDFVL